jgi:hypothetical protein
MTDAAIVDAHDTKEPETQGKLPPAVPLPKPVQGLLLAGSGAGSLAVTDGLYQLRAHGE